MLATVLALAASSARAQEPITLIDLGDEPVPVAGHIAELHDAGGTWSLDDVRRPERAAQLKILTGSAANHGLSEGVYWYRMVLQAPDQPNAESTWILSVGIPMLNYVDVHVTRSDGRTDTTRAGDLRPAPGDLVPASDFAVPMGLQPGERVTVHVRVQTAGRYHVILHVRSPRGFFELAHSLDRFQGAVVGIMVVMAVYNFLIFLVIRDRAYAYYVLFIVSVLGASLVISGDARRWAGVNAPDLLPVIHVMPVITNNLTTLFSVLFGQAFMQTRIHAPRAHRITTLFAASIAIPIMLLPSAGLLPAFYAMGPCFAVNELSMLAVGAYLAWHGIRAARFYLVSWLVLFLAFTGFVLTSFGVLPAAPVFTYAPPIALCISVTLLSLALADRLNTERRGRAIAAEKAARLQTFLPQRVAELVGGGDRALLEPKRREVTVLVMDLRGFTPFSETSAPEDVMSVLREFYGAMGAIVETRGGTVEHFAGDSMLVFFNAPLELAQHEQHAVRAALDMQQAFTALREKWKKLGHELGLGIGIADGYATIGAIGFSGRSQYAAIGAVTNLAARLCSLAQHGEILTTSRVLVAAGPIVKSESAGEQSIKGFHRPVEVARVLALRPT